MMVPPAIMYPIRVDTSIIHAPALHLPGPENPLRRVIPDSRFSEVHSGHSTKKKWQQTDACRHIKYYRNEADQAIIVIICAVRAE
jgi:hypothetical protein